MEELTTETIKAYIANNNLVAIDFWATWCAPCKALSPLLDKFAKSNAFNLVVAKVNITNDTELAREYNVKSIPTIIVFSKGQELKRLVGGNECREFITKNTVNL